MLCINIRLGLQRGGTSGYAQLVATAFTYGSYAETRGYR